MKAVKIIFAVLAALWALALIPTQYALKNGLRGMFSWRLDNDHGLQGTEEDVDLTFTGAKTIYDTVRAYVNGASSAH